VKTLGPHETINQPAAFNSTFTLAKFGPSGAIASPYGYLTKRDLVVRISNETGMVQQDVLMSFSGRLIISRKALLQGRQLSLRNSVFSK